MAWCWEWVIMHGHFPWLPNGKSRMSDIYCIICHLATQDKTHKNIVVHDVFPPDNLWFGSGSKMNCACIYNLY